jgi:hypothetical protein
VRGCLDEAEDLGIGVLNEPFRVDRITSKFEQQSAAYPEYLSKAKELSSLLSKETVSQGGWPGRVASPAGGAAGRGDCVRSEGSSGICPYRTGLPEEDIGMGLGKAASPTRPCRVLKLTTCKKRFKRLWVTRAAPAGKRAERFLEHLPR